MVRFQADLDAQVAEPVVFRAAAIGCISPSQAGSTTSTCSQPASASSFTSSFVSAWRSVSSNSGNDSGTSNCPPVGQVEQVDQIDALAGLFEDHAQLAGGQRLPGGGHLSGRRPNGLLEPSFRLQLRRSQRLPPRRGAPSRVQLPQLLASRLDPVADPVGGNRHACAVGRCPAAAWIAATAFVVAPDPEPGGELRPLVAPAGPGGVAVGVEIRAAAGVVEHGLAAVEHGEGILAVDQRAPLGKGERLPGHRELALFERLAAGPAGKGLAGVVQLQEVMLGPGVRLLLLHLRPNVDQRPVVEIVPIVDGLGLAGWLFVRVTSCIGPERGPRCTTAREPQVRRSASGSLRSPNQPCLGVVDAVVPVEVVEAFARLGKRDGRGKPALLPGIVLDDKRRRGDACRPTPLPEVPRRIRTPAAGGRRTPGASEESTVPAMRFRGSKSASGTN